MATGLGVRDTKATGPGKVLVYPGIFRFDGDKLVWVQAKWPCPVDPKAWPRKISSRPTEFKSTKENGYGMEIMKKIDCGGYGEKPGYQPGKDFLPYKMAEPARP